MSIDNSKLAYLTESFVLKSLISEPTCFKGSTPTCIDLFLTNQKNRFMKSSTFETGISDYHKMITTIFKTTFSKGKPKVIKYRCFKSFDKETFENSLKSNLCNNDVTSFEKFHTIFRDTLDQFAPIKEKKVRFNNSRFMSKQLRKSIMIRSRLRNNYNKNRTSENWKKYKTQRNICTNLLKKTKTNYFETIDAKDITDNKRFWNTIKPFISEKSKSSNKVILVENDEIIKNKKDIANTMNSHFTNISKSLNLKIQEKSSLDNVESIAKIRENYHYPKFSFNKFTEDEIISTINNLPANKSTTENDIPVSILKNSIQVYSGKLTFLLNNCLQEGIFPDDLKYADVTPVFKKGDNTAKENYRPISTLSNFSKVFERLLHNQISNFMESKFSKFLTGFRKKHNTQHALLTMIETWKSKLNVGHKIGAIIMDLSKAFDTLNHDLLLAKLKAYGFDAKSVAFLKSYLSDRQQRCKIDDTFSDWQKLIAGVPQGSILGPLLFNIFINDLFLIIENCTLCNYADDNTLYACRQNLDDVIVALQKDFCKLSEWFHNNSMVLNPEKCYFMVLGTNDNIDFTYNQVVIKNSSQVKILGILIDNKLSFKTHINQICKVANQKLNAINRVSGYMSQYKRKLLTTSFIKSQFNYCPLIWMFCSKQSMDKINKIHERTMRLVINDYSSDFHHLLNLTNDISVHQRCINSLMTEVYKYINGLSPDLMNDVFTLRENKYNLRNFNIFKSENPRTNKYGLETIAYRSGQLWNTLPNNIRQSYSLTIFKKNIKNWNCDNCPCTNCKTYIPNLGFLA